MKVHDITTTASVIETPGGPHPRPRGGRGRHRSRTPARCSCTLQRADHARYGQADCRRRHQRSARSARVLTCQHRARRVRALLRREHGQRQAGGRRRSGGHHRGPVHRRARHAADHAYLPHRRRGHRRGYHPGSSPRGGAVRGPQAQARGDRLPRSRGVVHIARIPRRSREADRHLRRTARPSKDLPDQLRRQAARWRRATVWRPATSSSKAPSTRTTCCASWASRPCRTTWSRKCSRVYRLPGRRHRRQAHRGHRAPDAAQGQGGGSRRYRPAARLAGGHLPL